jgi:bifunctional pyridoxal-dependent enzyme with beta-cystathionase and maltose regulon repressor activities
MKKDQGEGVLQSQDALLRLSQVYSLDFFLKKHINSSKQGVHDIYLDLTYLLEISTDLLDIAISCKKFLTSCKLAIISSQSFCVKQTNFIKINITITLTDLLRISTYLQDIESKFKRDYMKFRVNFA